MNDSDNSLPATAESHSTRPISTIKTRRKDVFLSMFVSKHFTAQKVSCELFQYPQDVKIKTTIKIFNRCGILMRFYRAVILLIINIDFLVYFDNVEDRTSLISYQSFN